MSDTRKKRELVKEAYADALKRSQESEGCCASGPVLPAGYHDELERHGEAADSSFGCGNPLAFAGVEPGQTVLDLGSGAGLDLLIAAEKVGPEGKVIGVDMTDAMIDAARANIARAGFGDRVEVRKSIIEELPVEEDSVDWVISNCVINLSPEKPRVFAEIARVLKPGGRISISDIVVKDLPEWVRNAAAAYTGCIGGAIDEAEYVGGLRDAGLADVEVTERMVYEREQLESMLKTDAGCGCDELEKLAPAIGAVAGQVWSARIVGRKPS